MKVEKIKNLQWFKPYCIGMFDHHTLCRYMQMIAGGDPGEYKRLATKMIAFAKANGQIRPADGMHRYYVFVDTEGSLATKIENATLRRRVAELESALKAARLALPPLSQQKK